MVSPVERRRALVEDAAGEAVDVRDDEVRRAAGTEQPRHVAEELPRPVHVLEHGQHRHDVVLAVQLLDGRVVHVEVELVAGVRERASPELGAAPRPAAVDREPEEQPDRRADVEEPGVDAMVLELVEDLGELLAVELDLAR